MKIAKMLMWAVLAVLIIGVPLIAIFVGYLFYLVIGLLATPIALAYKAKRQADGDNYDPMRVLPRLAVPDAEITTIGGRLPQLLVIPSGESQKSVIERNETLRDLLRTYLSDIEANPAVHWQDLESARALQVATQDEG